MLSNEEIEKWKSTDPRIDSIKNFNYTLRNHLIFENFSVDEYLIAEEIVSKLCSLRDKMKVKNFRILKEVLGDM